VDVVYDERKKLFYAVYNMAK